MHSSRHAATWAALSCAALLAACGGGGDRRTVTAVDDAHTMDWRTSADVDVVANDSVNRGTLVLAAVGTPAHGTAEIVDGRVRYTPAADFFGTDSVLYTVESDNGKASATATLALTVQARLLLSGVVTDAPLAGAAVTVDVGDDALEATADDAGRYEVEAVSADPQAFVRVTGVSSDGRVRLVSLVGELAAVAARADDDGAVGSEAFPPLDATHWTSAEAALMARALGGELPASAEQLEAGRAAVRPGELLQLATVVRLIADLGAEVPEGVADTLALLLDADAAEAFVLAQPGDVFAAAQAEVLAEAPGRDDGMLVVDAPRTLAYVLNTPFLSSYMVAALQADGSARASIGSGTRQGSWTYADGTLAIDFTTPIVQPTSAFWTDPATGQQQLLAAEARTFGVRARQVLGEPAAGSAMLSFESEFVFVEGPPAGQPVSSTATGGGILVSSFDVDRRAGVSDLDVAAGSRIGGLFAGAGLDQYAPEYANGTRADVLRFGDTAGSASFEVSGKPASWTLDDGWLEVAVEGAPTARYTRLFTDAATGNEAWLARWEGDGGEQWAEVQVAAADPDLVFTEATAARRWRNEGSFVGSASSADPGFVLFPDGTASGLATRWQLGDGGTLITARPRPANNPLGPGERLREWIPLTQVGPHWIVLETVDFGFGIPADIQWRVVWYRDLGPAVLPD